MGGDKHGLCKRHHLASGAICKDVLTTDIRSRLRQGGTQCTEQGQGRTQGTLSHQPHYLLKQSGAKSHQIQPLALCCILVPLAHLLL